MPRLVRISSSYPNYLESFAKAHPSSSQLPYRDQKDLLDRDANAWADYWGNALKPHGYETDEFVLNFDPGQKRWAEERGLPPEMSRLQIIRRQVVESRPDILFVNDYSNFSRAWIEELREACPTIRLVLGWCGAPYANPEVFNAYDLVLSCIPELVDDFRKNGHRSLHLPHAFDSRILERLKGGSSENLDFTFIGQIIREDAFHAERERILSLLVKSIPIEIFSPSGSSDWCDRLWLSARQNAFKFTQNLLSIGVSEQVLQSVPLLGKSVGWKVAPPDPTPPELKGVVRPPVFGLEMYRTLMGSKITFNNHIGISTNSASNMRLFEATGVGTCLLTDRKKDLVEYFEPDTEVATFGSPEECLEKARWLLNNPKERKEISRRGQLRTLRDHGFSNRAVVLDRYIREALP